MRQYLDKIVQLPFSLPEPQPLKVQRLVKSCLVGDANKPANVAKRLAALVEQLDAVKSPKLLVNFTDNQGTDTKGNPRQVLLKSKELVSELGPMTSLPPEVFLRHAARLLLVNETKTMLFGNETLKTNGLIKVLGDEGIEIMCNRLNEVVQGCQFYTNLGNDDPINDDPALALSAAEIDVAADTKLEDTTAAVKTINGIECTSSDIVFEQRAEPDRVSPHELAYFEKFIAEVDRNPRRLKRIVNTYQLVTEVARHRAVAEDQPEELVCKDKRWLPFTSKLIKWICLCECYPYRMSLLVLIIEDFEQKGAMNGVVAQRLKDHPDDVEQTKFVRWYDQTDESQLTTSLSKDELMTTVYFRCVEGFVYAHKIADKMLRLDSDAEQFAKLLMIPCSDDGSDDITVGDIIGLRSPSKMLRLGTDEDTDANFSLISYSFNLNAAMRAQLASERSGHMTESELSFSGKKSEGAIYGKNQQEKNAMGKNQQEKNAMGHAASRQFPFTF